MIWCITGASGLIGRALIEVLLNRGMRILALSRKAENFFREYSCHQFRACNYNLITDTPSKIGNLDDEVGLIMLASVITDSKNPSDINHILSADTYGHLRLMEGLKSKLKFALYASSCTVYGYSDKQPVEELDPLQPLNVYALTKITSERIFGEISKDWLFPLCILRISQVFGPGAPLTGALYSFLDSAVKGSQIQISCNPEDFRDYSHVDNIIKGIIAAIETRCNGIFNIGNGSATTLLELARICLKIVGRNDEPKIKSEVKAGNMFLNIERARKILGYNPSIDIMQGIISECHRLYGISPRSIERDFKNE